MKTPAIVSAMRAAAHTRKVEAMREGRVLRASIIPAKRGKGSYRRKNKYGDWT